MPRKGQTKPKVKCSETDCENFATCKGFCGKCYRRNERKDPEKRAIINERLRKFKTKDRIRLALLKSYGLDEYSYQQLYSSQKGLCAICHKPPKGKGKYAVLHIDHCHETGKVRGLLCMKCNLAIGHLRNSPRIIDSSIKYLLERDPKYENVP